MWRALLTLFTLPAVSGVLKDYLRELPYPLISKNLYEAVLESMATRPLRIGAGGCENDQADSEHTVGLLDSLPEVEKVRGKKKKERSLGLGGLGEFLCRPTQVQTFALLNRTSPSSSQEAHFSSSTPLPSVVLSQLLIIIMTCRVCVCATDDTAEAP